MLLPAGPERRKVGFLEISEVSVQGVALTSPNPLVLIAPLVLSQIRGSNAVLAYLMLPGGPNLGPNLDEPLHSTL
jgi:hypothetical protein